MGTRPQDRLRSTGVPLGRLGTWVDAALRAAEASADAPTPSTGRYEFKYLVRAEQIDPITAFLSGRLELDKYGESRLRDSYTVRSIYYDSPTFRCYHEKAAGEKNRRKYRVRAYNAENSSAAYLECKQRRGATYTKRKTRLEIASLTALRARAGFDRSIAEPGGVLGQLLVSMDRWQYAPVALVVYDRAAYVSPGQQDTMRVTLDRNLRARLFPDLAEIHSEADLTPLLYGWTILEVKFNDVVPDFLGYLTALHDLQRQACSKYAMSIACLLDENPTKREGWNHVDVF